MRISLLALSLALLAGCATPYWKYVPWSQEGYQSTRIQDDVLQVSFSGNAMTPRAQAEYYALVRAAELTVQQGRPFVRIVGGDTDIKTSQVFIPGQTYVNSNTYGNYSGNAWATRYGNTATATGYGTYSGNTFTTVNSTPSYAATLQKPIVTLTVLTLPRRVDPCLDARQVLQGAIEKRLKLEPATIASLARLGQ